MRRPSRITSSASACRPLRYSATIRLPRSRSRNGCSAHERPQLTDEVGIAPGGEVGGHPLLDRLHVQLLEGRRSRLGELLEAMVGDRLAAPFPQRRREVVACRLGIAVGERAASPLQQPLEPAGVDRLRVDVEHVAGRAVPEPDGRSEAPAQTGDLLLQRLHAVVAGRVVGPQRRD